jgi:hypothetical protein
MEYAEPTKFDPLSVSHGPFHRRENGFHRINSLDLGYLRFLGNPVDDIGLDHPENLLNLSPAHRTSLRRMWIAVKGRQHLNLNIYCT